MKGKKHLLIMSLVLLLALLVVGCGSDAPAQETEKVTEEVETKEEVEAVSSASVVDNNEDFLVSISPDGNWITALTKDLTFDDEIVLDGQGFESNGNPDRKIGLYSGDGADLETYTLTAPKLTIKSSPARLVNGSFIGDIYVEADEFLLDGVQVEGNVYFLTEAAQEGFVNKDSSISGEVGSVD